MKILAQRILDESISRRGFLDWYLWRCQDEGADSIPNDFAECIELALRDRGAEEVDVFLTLDYYETGYIHIKMGVQEAEAEEPRWMSDFVDSVCEISGNLYTVVTSLVDDMLYER